jgi:hypothetical protein
MSRRTQIVNAVRAKLKKHKEPVVLVLPPYATPEGAEPLVMVFPDHRPPTEPELVAAIVAAGFPHEVAVATAVKFVKQFTPKPAN